MYIVSEINSIKMSPNSTTRIEHLLLRVRKEHLRPGAHRDKTRGQHPDIIISIRVQNMMKPQQMVWVMIKGVRVVVTRLETQGVF